MAGPAGVSTEVRAVCGGFRYDVEAPGYKCNMTDLAAALGIKQLRRLDGLVERRRRLAARYEEALRHCRGLVLPADDPDGYRSRYLYAIQVVSQRVSRDRFVGFGPGDFPVAEQVDRVIAATLEILEGGGEP